MKPFDQLTRDEIDATNREIAEHILGWKYHPPLEGRRLETWETPEGVFVSSTLSGAFGSTAATLEGIQKKTGGIVALASFDETPDSVLWSASVTISAETPYTLANVFDPDPMIAVYQLARRILEIQKEAQT